MEKRICALLLTGVVGINLIGCGLMPKEEEYPTTPVLSKEETEEYKVATVGRRDIQVVEEVRSLYTPAETERYGFKVGNEVISEVYVDLGDEVKAGDVLAELDVSQQKEEIRRQKEQVDDLYLEREHLKESMEISLQEAVLQDQYANENHYEGWKSQEETVKAKYDDQFVVVNDSIYLAELRLEKAEREMENRQIIATMDGTVTELYQFKEDELVQKNKTVIKISDLDSVMFRVYSDNSDLLTVGETYTLVCGSEEYEVVAELIEWEELQDEVVLKMVDPTQDVEVGANGVIQFIMQERKGVLCIPKSAVTESTEGSIVYCVNEKGFRELREVELGLDDGTVIEVLSGLEEGELVIID
ncbi:MAG: biotin/lipoyl-binding protein [Firmicutes bacterium]|nr:biotin/lipoyl-binding protein [Bacillota bacterium]